MDWVVVVLTGIGCFGAGLILGVGLAIVAGCWYDVTRDYEPHVN